MSQLFSKFNNGYSCLQMIGSAIRRTRDVWIRTVSFNMGSKELERAACENIRRRLPSIHHSNFVYIILNTLISRVKLYSITAEISLKLACGQAVGRSIKIRLMRGIIAQDIVTSKVDAIQWYCLHLYACHCATWISMGPTITCKDPRGIQTLENS